MPQKNNVLTLLIIGGQQKKLPLYPHNRIIKNEYLKFKVNQHCKSDEFKKILVKYGADKMVKERMTVCLECGPCGYLSY